MVNGTRKLGYKYALNTTIKIAEHLPNRDDPKMFKKSVQAIFNDMLQRHTSFTRSECRSKVKELNEKLKKVLK